MEWRYNICYFVNNNLSYFPLEAEKKNTPFFIMQAVSLESLLSNTESELRQS